MLYKSSVLTPIGSLGLLANKEKLLKLSFKGLEDIPDKAKMDSMRFELIFKEIEEYFAGDRKQFSFNYQVKSSPFSERVYSCLLYTSDAADE